MRQDLAQHRSGFLKHLEGLARGSPLPEEAAEIDEPQSTPIRPEVHERQPHEMFSRVELALVEEELPEVRTRPVDSGQRELL